MQRSLTALIMSKTAFMISAQNRTHFVEKHFLRLIAVHITELSHKGLFENPFEI